MFIGRLSRSVVKVLDRSAAGKHNRVSHPISFQGSFPMPIKFIAAALVALMFAGAAPAQAPVPAQDPENILLLDLSTGGRVAIQLWPELAPRHVERIKALTRQNFYNGLLFHRVIPGFMAQTGDPQGTGEGGSPLPDLASEFNIFPHLRGVVSMARTDDPNSANSQFFIMLHPRMSLDGKYTGFGRVISGMSYVDLIEKGEPPANPSRIVRASIAADNIPPPVPGQPIPTFAASVAPAPQPVPAGPTEQPAVTPPQ
jgi:cyclophilin family peptidyl-prolyl cis-trans isomerase